MWADTIGQKVRKNRFGEGRDSLLDHALWEREMEMSMRETEKIERKGG